MELEFRDLEFDDKDINSLIKKINEMFKHQQVDFANLCYAVYKIDCWFSDNPELLLKSKYNGDYYNRKKLFKALGISNKQANRYCACYEKFMTLDDIGSKLKEPFVLFTSSKLFELLPLSYSKLIEFIENKQITPNMTVKEIREFLKSIEEKTEASEDEEKTLVDEEDKFLILKNDTARKDFLENYKTWGLWFEEQRLKLKYYRCKIGNKILVAVFGKVIWSPWNADPEIRDDHKFYFMSDNDELILDPTCETEILKVMSKIVDKKVYLF